MKKPRGRNGGRKRQTSLPLPLTRERAYELTEAIPLSAVFVADAVGYYFARFRRNNVARCVYIGAPIRVEEIERAHAIVRADLEAEQEAKLTAEIREMLVRHNWLIGSPPNTPGTKRVDPSRGANALGSLLVAPPRERQASR